VFSQSVLLALVEAGRTRDEAYRIVQRAATRSWVERRPFRGVLDENAEVRATLPDQQLDACFDLDRVLAHAGRAVDALGAESASRA
jgi:adenylosuccinate lyase